MGPLNDNVWLSRFAGNVPAANDFICKLQCEWGPNAFANQVKGQRAQLPAGIYDPPYRINNENSQVSDAAAGPCRCYLEYM